MGQRIESQTRESTEWLRRFWEPHLRDQADFNRPMDYLHWNPSSMALWRRWPIGRIPRFTVTCGPGFIRGMGAQAKPPPSIPKILANHRFRRVASPTINSRIESQENGGHRGFPFYEMPPVFIVWFGIRYWWAMPTLPSSMKIWSWEKDHPLILVRCALRNRVRARMPLKLLVGGAHPTRLVQDNLNTHTPGSFYRAFPRKRRSSSRSDLNCTIHQKKGSWLNMAEIELAALARQRLRRVSDVETLQKEATIWTDKHNKARKNGPMEIYQNQCSKKAQK
jgi:hypothetical protein